MGDPQGNPTNPDCFKLQAVDDRRVTLQSRLNNLYVWAENAGGGRVAIAASAIGPWEKYQLVGLGGNRAAFKTGNDINFLTAEDGGGRESVANRTGTGPWETFLIENC